MKKEIFLTIIVVSLLSIATLLNIGGESSNPYAQEMNGEGDIELLAAMDGINRQLAAQGKNIALYSIDFYAIGGGRQGGGQLLGSTNRICFDQNNPGNCITFDGPFNRVLNLPAHWVADDPRRSNPDTGSGSTGNTISYIADQSWPGGLFTGSTGTLSGVSQVQTEEAIDSAMLTMNMALPNVNIVKQSSPGGDITIFDHLFCLMFDFPPAACNAVGLTTGTPFSADIVHAGWVIRNGCGAIAGVFVYTEDSDIANFCTSNSSQLYQ